MRQEIQQLLILQNRDTKITALTKDIANIPRLIEAASKRLANDQKAVDDAKAAMFDIEKAIKSLELDVQTRQNTIAKLKVQQFETRKNEEFTAFGNEIVRYGNDVTQLEDKELELMEKLEDAKTMLDEKRASLAKVEESVNKEIADLETRLVNKQTELEEFTAKRSDDAEGIDEKWLELYERLLIRKPPAVVPVDHADTCGGCHMKLTGAIASDARAERGIVQCGSCARILYTPN